MIIKVRKSIIIRPAEETPRRSLWCSNLDLVAPQMHVPTIYFYRHRVAAAVNFFDAEVMKEALSKVLVPLYPMAGRLRREEDNRIGIDCNSEGVLFAEADTDTDMITDLAPTPEIEKLIPTVDESADIGSYPLLAVQVTNFKCGGVSLGVSLHHFVADGTSAFSFIKTWSEIARGLDITTPPFLDRTVLRARQPPLSAFPHVEYHPPPPLKTPQPNNPQKAVTSIFNITRHQLDALKKESMTPENTTFSSFVSLTAHIWRCTCKARALLADQDTKLTVPVNSRSRLRPALPPGYLGNAIFTAASQALAGDVVSKPLSYACKKIHDAVCRMDDEYLRSALDYFEVQPNIMDLACNKDMFKCPNMDVVSWIRLPTYDADFGWGRPIFMGPAGIGWEGQAYLVPSPTDDGSFSLFITLHQDFIEPFQKYFYEI